MQKEINLLSKYPKSKRDLNERIESKSESIRKIARQFGKEFFGEIPINSEVGKCGDEGKPIVEAYPDHEISKIYLKLANKIKDQYL